MSEKICTIVLNWNGKDDALECLRSLFTAHPPSSVWLVDNGSMDDSVQVLRREFPDLTILENGENLGLAEGYNRALRLALNQGFEWVFLLHHDTVVNPDLFDRFQEAIREKPSAKILGAKIYRYKDPQRIDHLGGIWLPDRGYFQPMAFGHLDGGTCFEEMEKVDCVCGTALFIHRNVLEKIGLFEGDFFLSWGESDFCVRAAREGFFAWTAPQMKVWHKAVLSQSGGSPRTEYFWWKGRLLWIERNCTAAERRRLLWTVLLPSLGRELGHFIWGALQGFWKQWTRHPLSEKEMHRKLRAKAALLGAWHHWRGKDREDPCWLSV